VLPDADLDLVGDALLRSCLRNTGQTCFVSARMVVTRERYDEVVSLAAATVSAATVGDPLEAATVFGPLATAAQRDVVLGYVRSGIEAGARVVAGGEVAAPFGGRRDSGLGVEYGVEGLGEYLTSQSVHRRRR
jgi:aldehyde dehydrogenase (NAD+)